MIYSRGGIPAPPCESPRRPRGRGDRDNRSVGPFGPEEFFYHETSKLPRLPQASAPPSARGNQGRAPWRSRSGTRTVTTRQASGSRTVTTRQPHGWYPATEPHPHSCAFPVPLRAGSRYGASMLQERRPDARLWREELRAMVALAWPLVLTNVTSTLISSTDVVLLGWAGSRTLAAGTLGMNLYVAFLIFGMGVVFNAFLNYGLILGHWGFPALGLTGAGIGSSCANLFMFLGMAIVVTTHRRFRRYRLFGRWWRADWQRFRQVWTLGGPIAVTLGLEITIFNAAVFLMGLIGAASIAAHAVAIQIAAFTFMVPLGLAQAVTVRVGLAYGRRDREGIARAGWTAWILGVSFMAAMALVIYAAPH